MKMQIMAENLLLPREYPSSSENEEATRQAVRNALGQPIISDGIETPINGREACKIIGCCYEHLLKECKAGRIPHFKLGNRYWFRPSSLQKWIANQEQSNLK